MRYMRGLNLFELRTLAMLMLVIVLLAWSLPAFAGEIVADSRGSPVVLEIGAVLTGPPAGVLTRDVDIALSRADAAAEVDREICLSRSQPVLIALAIGDAEEGDGATQAPGEPLAWYSLLSPAIGHVQALRSGQTGTCYILGLTDMGSIKSRPIVLDLLFAPTFDGQSDNWGAGISSVIVHPATTVKIKGGVGIVRCWVGYLSIGF